MTKKVVLAAQFIRAYRGPQWLVEPNGAASDQQDIRAINRTGWTVIDTDLQGWDPYNAIIHVEDEDINAYYLAQIKS